MDVVKQAVTDLSIELNIEAFPYSTDHDPISFQEVLDGSYPVSGSPFKDSAVARKRIMLLEKNGIKSFAIIGKTLFVTYRDSIAREGKLPYHFLQFEGVITDRTKFLPNSFVTLDYKDGLYLFRKVPIN